jgi:hypothetical protein
MAEAKSDGKRSDAAGDTSKDEGSKDQKVDSAQKNQKVDKAQKSRRSAAAGARETVQSVRKGVASAVWLLAVLAAVILAAGALVIALDFNRRNGVVSFFVHTADNINFLGTLKKFDPAGKSPAAQHSALVKTVLVNWGICALVYLVLGKILDRVIRP